MRELVQSLARNPEAVAIAAICLALGVGRDFVPRHLQAVHTAHYGVYQVWGGQRQAADAECAVRAAIEEAQRSLSTVKLPPADF